MDLFIKLADCRDAGIKFDVPRITQIYQDIKEEYERSTNDEDAVDQVGRLI
jgi:hypothetical protein